MRTQTSAFAIPADVFVTNHAVRRFAERADRVPSPPETWMSDAQAVSHLARAGYPVEQVRAMLAVHAQDGVRAGASRVRFDRVLLCIKGGSVVTCLPG